MTSGREGGDVSLGSSPGRCRDQRFVGCGCPRLWWDRAFLGFDGGFDGCLRGGWGEFGDG